MPINWRLRQLLVDKEMTQSQLITEVAETLKVKRQSVRNVISGSRAKRIEDAIAARLGALRNDLFFRHGHKRIVSGKRAACK
jgi:DNA-binding Xre family transcriptional regulator